MAKKVNIVGLDLGNGYMKFTSKEKTTCEKSVYTLTRQQIDGTYKGHSINGNPHKLFGAEAENSGYNVVPILGDSDSLRYQDPIFYEFIISKLTGVVDILVIGLPNHHFRKQKDVLIKMLEGVTFTNNGNKVQVKKVVPVPQPLGSYLSSNTPADKKVLIVDIGHGTVDYSVFKDSELINAFSTSNGMKKAYEPIMEYLKYKYPDYDTKLINISDTLVSGVKIGGECYRVLDEVFIQEELGAHFQLTHREIVDHFGSTQAFDAVVFTGGGAMLHLPRIKKLMKEYSNIKYIEDAQTANSRGFYKLGGMLNG